MLAVGEAVEFLVEGAEVHREPGVYRLAKGLHEIAAAFDAYLDSGGARHSKAV